MMASIIDSRHEIPEGQIRDYSAYCGAFTFDGETLITRVDASVDADRIGTDQVRGVSFEGELMVLRPPLRSYGGRPAEQRVIWWEKLSDV